MIFHGETSKTPNGEYLFNDSRFTYLGRWDVGANGMVSGWASSSIEFKVKNTSSIKIKAYINRTTTTIIEAIGFHIDLDPNQTSGIAFDSNTGTLLGYRTLSLPIANDGMEHSVILHTLSNTPLDSFNQNTLIYFNSITLDAGGVLLAKPQGAKKIQYIGDSWLATSNDWARLVDETLYSAIQIAGSGYTLSVSDSRYNYDYTGVLNTSDVAVDAVVISFGVNDYLAGVSIASFQTSLLSLIDKVRLKQPNVKIFLVRVLNNGSNLYGQYLTSMNNAAGLRSNVIVVDTTSLDSGSDWVDSGHLGANSKLALGALVKTQLLANGI